MARTDAHRPAAIVPADYDYVAHRYFGPDALEVNPAGARLVREHMDRTGGKYSGHEHGGSCHICGAHALYTAVFYHRPSNAYIITGLDCADKMGFDSGDGDAFRKQIRAALEARAGKRKAEAVLEQNGLGAAWAVYCGPYSDRFEESTITDIVGKLVKYGSISDKQMSFVGSLLNKINNRVEIAKARAAADAASTHIGTVGERREFTATVVFVASFETQFGTMFVNGLKDQAGNVVIYKGSKSLAAKGDMVKFVATVKEHGTREGVKQTIVARPGKVEVQGAGEAAIAA
jgi:hypothetical protein